MVSRRKLRFYEKEDGIDLYLDVDYDEDDYEDLKPNEVLGIKMYSSTPQIKRAYRTLAKKYHPDINKRKNAAKMFKKIKWAYDSAMVDDWKDEENDYDTWEFPDKISVRDVNYDGGGEFDRSGDYTCEADVEIYGFSGHIEGRITGNAIYGPQWLYVRVEKDEWEGEHREAEYRWTEKAWVHNSNLV